MRKYDLGVNWQSDQHVEFQTYRSVFIVCCRGVKVSSSIKVSNSEMVLHVHCIIKFQQQPP